MAKIGISVAYRGGTLELKLFYKNLLNLKKKFKTFFKIFKMPRKQA